MPVRSMWLSATALAQHSGTRWVGGGGRGFVGLKLGACDSSQFPGRPRLEPCRQAGCVTMICYMGSSLVQPAGGAPPKKPLME